MVQQKLIKFIFLVLLFETIFTNSSFAQTPICNLKIKIFELGNEKLFKAIENPTINLIDLSTKKSIKPVLTGETLFSELGAGKYKLEIIKDGYQRRIKEIEVGCKTADEILTISKVLYLQKGSPKEITKFSPTVYGVHGTDQQFKAKENESTLNGGALILAKPQYPAAGRAVRASGAVNIQVIIDEDGEIISAHALSGHPLLRQAAERSAIESRFAPTMLNGQPVKITGIIVYNFVP